MNFGNKKKSIYKRVNIFFVITIIVFTGLFIRLFYIQIKDGKVLEVSANAQYYEEEDINNLSFNILDRNNKEIFDVETLYYAVIDPKIFFTGNKEDVFKEMKNIIYILRGYNKNYNIELLQYKMDKGKVYYIIDEQCFSKINEVKNLKGIYTYKYTKRNVSKNWNIKNILVNFKKYSNDLELKDKGTLERELYEFTKDNKKEKIRFEKDVSGNIIDKYNIEYENNKNVVLTLDKQLQIKAEEILKKDNYNMYPQIGLLLMESNTGNILAMAQKDDSISNINIGVPSGNGFLIGSVFKTIVYEAALDKKLVTTQEDFKINHIFKKIKSNEKDSNISKAYEISSNDIFAQVGWRVGMDTLYEYANKQGLFDKVLNLQDERIGILEGYGKEENINIITNTSIGQTVRVTPLEAISIPNTIINDGIYIKPRIVDKIIDNNGSIVKEYTTEKKRIIDDNLANYIKGEMINVVSGDEGTGKKADIKGIEVGGKTGTTEYFIGDKECSDGWFCGFFKYNNKYYSVVVFIPEIDLEKDAGGGTACLVFKNFVNEIIVDKYLQ